MSRVNRFSTTAAAVNIFRNAAFKYGTETSLAFWTLINASLQSSAGNTVEQETNLPLNAPYSSSSALKIVLADSADVFLFQSFLLDDSAVFDFIYGEAAKIPNGMLANYRHLVPAGTYTVAFNIHVRQGAVRVRPYAVNHSGAEVLTEPSEIAEAAVTLKATQHPVRIAVPVHVYDNIASFGLRLQRTSSAFCEISISNMSFVKGSYTALPYTGDPHERGLPAGAVILVLGSTCPPGYEPLGNDELEPLPEWVETNANVQARVGNFPRTGTELAGTELHGEEITLSAGEADFVSFVSSASKAVIEETAPFNPSTGKSLPVNPSADLPGGPNNTPTHPHVFRAAPTRPVSRSFLMCRRLS